MDRPACEYHSTTSYERSKMGGHFLDWENQPDLLKTYADRELIEMPKEIPLPKEDLFTLHDHPSVKEKPKAVTDLADLSRILTAIFFRSAWKYRARAYRYHLMDTGHVLENLILSLKAAGFPFEFRFDFDDRQINRLLGLDETLEVALAIVQVAPHRSHGDPKNKDVFQELPEDVKSASRVASREIEYPEICVIHTAGYGPVPLNSAAPDMLNTLGLTPGSWITLPSGVFQRKTTPYPEAVFRRRSRRNFTGKHMPLSFFHSILNVLCAKENFTQESYANSFCIGFLAGQVESFVSGLYLLDRESGFI